MKKTLLEKYKKKRINKNKDVKEGYKCYLQIKKWIT